MAKIAVELAELIARRTETGAPGSPVSRLLAQGDGWSVEDVVCTSGPRDRPYEEQHAGVSIAVVAAGTFQYRSEQGRALMTPGSLLLGNPGQVFECSHEHAAGDRCIAFRYDAGFFERLDGRPFRSVRLPPLRGLSPLVSRAIRAAASDAAWADLAVESASEAIRLASGASNHESAPPPGALARVTRTVRAIERSPEIDLSLDALARAAGLSPFHFLRVFQQATGVTPHRYVLRARLREAAMRLAGRERASSVLDIALDCGFGDVSSFNRAFRSEFRLSPREYRAACG